MRVSSLSMASVVGVLLPSCLLNEDFRAESRLSSAGGSSLDNGTYAATPGSGGVAQAAGGRSGSEPLSSTTGVVSIGGHTTASSLGGSGGIEEVGSTGVDSETGGRAFGGGSETGGQAFGGGSETGGQAFGGTTAASSTEPPSTSGTWVSIATPSRDFVARAHASVAVFDGKVFVFGGVDAYGQALDTGAIFDPIANTWEDVVLDENSPSPRQDATAVYVNGKILVWGGRFSEPRSNEQLVSARGATYDPVERRWSPIADGWTARADAAITVSGERVLFWGGRDADGGPLGGGEIYNASTNQWEWMNSTDAPSRVVGATVVAGEGTLFIFGGILEDQSMTDRCFVYDLANNQWSELFAGPSARSGGLGTWDGSHFYVWGGRDGGGTLSDGWLYSRSWIEMAPATMSDGRFSIRDETGWGLALAADDVAFVGGFDNDGNVRHDGIRYVRSSDSWSRIEAWPSGEDHRAGVAAWVNRELILFGGWSGSALTATGERLVFSP